MKITIEQLRELNACPGGIEWYEKQGTTDLEELVEAAIKQGTFITSEGKIENTLKFANWGLVRIMPRPQKVQYAIFAARQVLKIFEEKHPEDRRPRLAIEAAEAYLKEPTEENRQKTKTAYAAAADAAAATAAYAAAAADAYAAYAAADAAAATAAYAAAAADAYDADKNQILAKILRYGVEIICHQPKAKED